MDDLSDKELGALLTQTMRAHEGDTDPGRAREIARRAEPARLRPSPWVIGAAAATVLAVVLGVGGYVGTHRETSTPDAGIRQHTQVPNGGVDGTPGEGSAGSTTSGNYRLAQQASTEALAALDVPPGASALTAKPSGWPDGGESLGPSDYRLTRTGWWTTSLTKQQVADFFRSHSGEGMRHPRGEEVINDGSSDGVATTEYDVFSPSDPAAYTSLTILVQFAQVGDHTVLRADTFLAARYAVPADYRITQPVATVRIERTKAVKHPFGQTRPLPAVTLTGPQDRPDIARLVHAFNHLRGSWTEGGSLSCPFMPSTKTEVTFTTADGTTVRSHLTGGCWSQVAVAVDGAHAKPTLDPGNAWVTLVNDIANHAG